MVLHEQECVPVILSDEVEFPFQNVIDYRKFTIKWPATRIGPQLLEYLESVSGKSSTTPRFASQLFTHSQFFDVWQMVFVPIRWRYKPHDRSGEKSEVLVCICSGDGTMLRHARNLVGNAKESEAISTINWNILASQWDCCRPGSRRIRFLDTAHAFALKQHIYLMLCNFHIWS